jgi:Fe-S cluster assembly protein SufD
MLAEDGAEITVPAGIDGGVLVLAHLATGGGFHPRHAVRLGEGARLVLVEIAIGRGAAFHNPVICCEVSRGATLVHTVLQDESAEAVHLATIHAEVAAGATYDSFMLALGARLARRELHVRLAGPGAVAHLNAAQLAGGSQHLDFTTSVVHAAPSATSRQTVKNVLAGRARGVFQGSILVERDAQKTDGYQMNQALLLSPTAEVDAKPGLEIYADDVKCSHGTAIGELDADQLFYLRSRGVPEREARAMLVRAFIGEALDGISFVPLRDEMERRIGAWWEAQQGS